MGGKCSLSREGNLLVAELSAELAVSSVGDSATADRAADWRPWMENASRCYANNFQRKKTQTGVQSLFSSSYMADK